MVSNIFSFHPYLGKIPILTNIFSDGLKPPTRLCLSNRGYYFPVFILYYMSDWIYPKNYDQGYSRWMNWKMTHDFNHEDRIEVNLTSWGLEPYSCAMSGFWPRQEFPRVDDNWYMIYSEVYSSIFSCFFCAKIERWSNFAIWLWTIVYNICSLTTLDLNGL